MYTEYSFKSKNNTKNNGIRVLPGKNLNDMEWLCFHMHNKYIIFPIII